MRAMSGAAHVTPSPAVTALRMDERDRDVQGVALPRPDLHLVVRFGSLAHNGLEVHALGVRQTVHRKLLRTGLRTVAATLQVGTSQAVFGVPASALAGRIVALEDLWSPAATQRLYDQLADARDMSTVAAVLEGMLSERVARCGRDERAALVLEAAAQLVHANVNTVADELGLSERQLRRVFHEMLGVSPKAFSKLQRFQRALDAAHTQRQASWASVAVAAGYYDQAHLIAEFRAIAGATPRALLGELRAAYRF